MLKKFVSVFVLMVLNSLAHGSEQPHDPGLRRAIMDEANKKLSQTKQEQAAQEAEERALSQVSLQREAHMPEVVLSAQKGQHTFVGMSVKDEPLLVVFKESRFSNNDPSKRRNLMYQGTKQPGGSIAYEFVKAVPIGAPLGTQGTPIFLKVVRS